ncbi:MAG: DUF4382 domain-containing protein [Pseudomonadota bacterium]
MARTILERLRTPGAARARDALIYAAMVIAMIALSACSGGGGGDVADEDPIAGGNSGLLYVGLTDAEGDFVTYAVDVDSILLERANGTTVETLPLSTRVDFAELTEVTEFLSIATVPAGNYVAASIRLDFSEAQVVVQNETGVITEAEVVDEAGNPLAEYEVRLQLANTDIIRIAPGIPAAFSLDFDLDASNEIDRSVSPPIVTVSPLLLAQAELEEDREHRVRGVLAEASIDDSAFTLKVRPFKRRTGDFGRFTVNVDEETQYEVDGVGYTGAAGLEAVAALAENTPVVANGSISNRSMMADIVVAGSSVPWADDTVVKGVVTARNGDSLTIGGARVEFGDGRVDFGGSFEVLLGEATTVTAPGVDNADLNTDSISVGQRIVAFGEPSATDLVFDATDGRIVMQFSQFTAVVAQEAPLAAELGLYNGRRPGAYDFAGTGSAPELDADPDFYEIDTGALLLNDIELGDLIRVRGLVTPFGAAPEDFTARTVIDIETSRRAGELKVVWPADAPSATPFIATSPTTIDVDISESAEWLRVRGIPRFITNPLEMLTIAATDSGQGVYAVHVRGSGVVTTYRNFADLVDALNAELEAGNALRRINARVGYTGATDVLVSPRASFVFVVPGDAE